MADKPYRENSVSKDMAEGSTYTSMSFQSFLSLTSPCRGSSLLPSMFKEKKCTDTYAEDENI